jgi:hypothetical protein
MLGSPGPAADVFTSTRAGMIFVLAMAGVAGLGNGMWMDHVQRPEDAVLRSVLLGAACLSGALYLSRGGRAGLVYNGLLGMVMVGVLTSSWSRGLTTTMLPLLIIASPIATATIGRRAGRFWLVVALAVLAFAAVRRGPVEVAVVRSELITHGLAIVVGGWVVLVYRRAHELQARRLSEANVALRAKEQAAQVANRAKSTFLATMSHEIRTPLNAVIGLAELLGDRPLPPADLARVRQIQDSGGLLLELLNDVLDMSRIEAGAATLRPEPVEPAGLVRKSVESLQGKAEARHLTLTLELDPALPRKVVLDPTRVRQILVNLVSNGIKFTQCGGVVVRVGMEAETGRLRVEVEDSGVGIAPAARGQIFERFRQADEGRDRAFGGSGLGLAISRTLAELMDGELELDWSEEGVGSRFVLRLPAPLPAPVASLAELPALAPDAVVMVVDDDPINRKVVRAMLGSLGLATQEACNGAQAVEAMVPRPDTERIDLVLMDQQMPVMDGIAATQKLRSDGVSVPIVALTANAFEEDRQACLAAGMDGFLTKPVSRLDLHRALAPFLSAPQTRRADAVAAP